MFINFSRRTTLKEHIDISGDYAHEGAEGIWEISVPSPDIFCELKTAL